MRTTERLRYVVFLLCVLGGCSVYMEATRPTPVDTAKFNPGDSRTSIMEQLGSPVTTSKAADGTACDLYLLYLRGYGAAGKVPIAVLEGAADVFTLGLAEIVLSPTEAVTKNEKRPVWFCYRDDKLVSVTVKQAGAEESATPTTTPVESSQAASSASASPTPVEAPSGTASPTGIATPVSPFTASATPTPISPTASATPAPTNG